MKKVILKSGKIRVEDMPEIGEPKGPELRLIAAASAISTGTETAQLISNPMAGPAGKRMMGKVAAFLKDHGVAATIKKIQERLGMSQPLGYSAAGIVESCGDGAAGFAPGDRVAVSGAQFANHSESLLASSRLAVKIPETVSFEEAATVAIGAIALQGVRRLEPQIGDRVAVIGLGLIGQITAQILTASGCRVTGIEKDQARLNFARERRWIEDTEPSTDMDGVVIAAHTPGDSSCLELAVRLSRIRGRIVALGDIGLSIPRQSFYEKELELRIATSYGPGRYDREYEERGKDYPYPFVRWTAQRNMACYLDLIARKKIEIAPLIQAVYPIEEAQKAYEVLQAAGPKPLLALLTYKTNGAGDAGRRASDSAQQQRVLAEVAGDRTRRVRVGIIGAGGFVTHTHIPILNSLKEDFEIASICNRHPEKAQSLARQHGAKACADARDIFEDPNIDLVLIGTRHDTHAKLAIDAISRGKAVFLEKPMATTLEDLEALQAAYAKNPVPFHIGFNRRYSPLIRELKEQISRQTGGCSLQYRVTTELLPRDHWILSPEGGGRIIGEGCHMVDLICYLFSSGAQMALPVNVKASGYDQSFTVSFQFEGGKMAVLSYFPSKARDFGKERIEIVTPESSFVLDDFRSTPSSAQQKGFREEWTLLRDYLSGKRKESIYRFEDAVEITKLTFLIDNLIKQA